MREYAKIYDGFDGIGRSDGKGAERLEYCVNMWRDYENDGGRALETVPGFRKLTGFGDKINGIYSHSFEVNGVNTVYLLVHSGSLLYAFEHTGRDSLPSTHTPILTLDDRTSCGYSFGDSFYIADGSDIFKISATESGLAAVSLSDAVTRAPLTYFDGVKKQSRNLLTRRFSEGYTLTEGAFRRIYNNNGLVFEVYDSDNGYAEVTGIKPLYSYVFVPRSVTINETEYAVKRIKTRAFAGSGIVQAVISSGIESIGDFAFSGCPELHTAVIFGNTSLGIKAFGGCVSLKRIWLGDEISIISDNAFWGCSSLEQVMYGGALWSSSRYDFGDTYIANNCIMKEMSVGDIMITDVQSDGVRWYYQREYSTEAMSVGRDEGVFAVTAVLPASLSVIGFGSGTNLRLSAFCVSDGKEAVSEDAVSAYDFELNEPCVTVNALYADDCAIVSENNYDDEDAYYETVSSLIGESTYITALRLVCTRDMYTGKRLVITGNAKINTYRQADGTFGSISFDGVPFSGNSYDAITKCTAAAVFDGRVFLTGNPELPNTVFYSGIDDNGNPDALFFGVGDRFNDGGENYINSALLATPSYLALLKPCGLSGGSVFFHVAEDAQDPFSPRRYPSGEGFNCPLCIGESTDFHGKSVFVSDRGIESLGAGSSVKYRSSEHFSTAVDRLMNSGGRLSEAKLAVWKDYLCVLLPGRIFLADDRKEGNLYEWYMLDGIGVYEGQSTVYRHCSVSPRLSNGITVEGMYIGSSELEIAHCEDRFDGTVYSGYPSLSDDGVYCEDAPLVYYCDVASGGVTHRYILDCMDDETDGGTFSAAVALCSVCGVLYFGCENGDVCCFNTDKRSEAFEFNGLSESVPENAIHREWYTFDKRRYKSGLVTNADNCGFPYSGKNTVSRSLVIKSKQMTGSRFEVCVKTDEKPWELLVSVTSSDANIYGQDFANMSYCVGEKNVSVLPERRHRWIEKRYYIYSDCHKSPFGIYEITYRYTLSGRIRERDAE